MERPYRIDIENLPIALADENARKRIEDFREQMAEWRARRARRLLAEQRATGKSARAIAEEVGVHFTAIADLIREAKRAEERDGGDGTTAPA